MASAALSSEGNVLICWSHEDIPIIAAKILDASNSRLWLGQSSDTISCGCSIFCLDREAGRFSKCRRCCCPDVPLARVLSKLDFDFTSASLCEFSGSHYEERARNGRLVPSIEKIAKTPKGGMLESGRPFLCGGAQK
jgi:hypothetical protein